MTTAAMLKTDPSEARLKEIAAIAEDAYIYGLPIVVNYATMFTFIDPGSRNTARHSTRWSTTTRYLPPQTPLW